MMYSKWVTNDLSRDESDYIKTHPESMLYHSEEWLRSISDITECEIGYLFVRDSYSVRGFMPICISRGEAGVVANSSAYFGSHGGILASDREAEKFLTAELRKFAKIKKIGILNIIEPLMCSNTKKYTNMNPAAKDQRIGQYVNLERFENNEAMLASFGGIVRSNLKRRAWKSGINVKQESAHEAVEEFADLHFNEMSKKPDGNPKTREFFRAIIENLETDEWRLYVGRIDGRMAAGLLIACWRGWAEYLVPAFSNQYEKYQPSTAVLYHAMSECRSQGIKWWNFGGTRENQKGVYDFKASWGAVDKKYYYYIYDFGGMSSLKNITKDTIIKEYHGFYLYPF